MLDDVHDDMSGVLDDIPGTLERLVKLKETVSARLAGINVDDAKELLQKYKIQEPLREGIAHLDNVLMELGRDHAQVARHAQMLASWLAEDPPKATRWELFEYQCQAALLAIQLEEQRDHRTNVNKRLGEQPTEPQVARAVAAVEMYDKLNEQLVEIARLESWFARQQEKQDESAA